MKATAVETFNRPKVDWKMIRASQAETHLEQLITIEKQSTRVKTANVEFLKPTRRNGKA